MSTDATTALQLSLVRGGRDGAEVLLGLVDPARAGDREQVSALVLADPRSAFAIVAQPKEVTGLTPRGAADVLDGLVGVFTDPEEARRRMDEAITPERQAEILQARGDLPSSAADVADPDVLLMTIMRDTADGFDDEAFWMFWLRAWALKLKDRFDWPEILEMEIDDDRTVRDFILAAVYIDAGLDDDESIDDISPDLFLEVGIDSDEGARRLQELEEDGRLPVMNDTDLERVRRRMAERRLEFERAVRTLTEQAADAAAAAAEEDEFKL